jgi:hypothetical protein
MEPDPIFELGLEVLEFLKKIQSQNHIEDQG